MALQHWLGVLSERRTWAGAADSRHSGSCEENLISDLSWPTSEPLVHPGTRSHLLLRRL
jgi:hypothetical protein